MGNFFKNEFYGKVESKSVCFKAGYEDVWKEMRGE